MKNLIALFVSCSLAGCASGGVDLSAGLDDTIKTSSVGNEVRPDDTQVSDAATIRNAVSAMDLEVAAGAPMAWANAGTGSRGTISSVSESKISGMLCRNFTASRESFDGVGLYKGQACASSPGNWSMQSFEQM